MFEPKPTARWWHRPHQTSRRRAVVEPSPRQIHPPRKPSEPRPVRLTLLFRAGSFFDSLPLQQPFSAAEKTWRPLAFCVTDPHARREAGVLAPAQVSVALCSKGPGRPEVTDRGPGMPAGRRRRRQRQAGSPRACTVSRSAPRSPPRDSGLRRLPWARSRTDGDRADPWALAADRKASAPRLGSDESGNPAVPAWRWGGAQRAVARTSPRCQSRTCPGFQIFQNEDEADSLTICSHKQAPCRVENETPTPTGAGEDPLVLSPQGHV